MNVLLVGVALILLSVVCKLPGEYLAWPVPASLLGLLLLLSLVILLRRVPAALSKVSQILLRNMALFFIPVTVSVFTLDAKVMSGIWIVTIALFTSTLLCLIVTAKIAQRILTAQSHEH